VRVCGCLQKAKKVLGARHHGNGGGTLPPATSIGAVRQNRGGAQRQSRSPLSRGAGKTLKSPDQQPTGQGTSVSRKQAETGARQDGGRPQPSSPPAGAARDDDTVITALKLDGAALTPAMQAYFDKCTEKLGFIPNVLKAYAFDMAKLEAFVAMYNDLMLAPSGLSKLEREMIAVAVSSQNRCYYCLAAHGAAVRALSDDPVLGELMVMNYRAARLDRRQQAMLDFAVKLTAEPFAIGEVDRAALREAGFSDRDIFDIAAVAGFFNMSNRVASATDMRPNSAYHGQKRG
jgi:uncharacterized peroxidase-related enzyme